MIVDANEILKSLIKCCGEGCIQKLDVVEFDDPKVKKNSTLFLGGGVGETPLYVPIKIRGNPKDRKSTANYAEELFEFFDESKHTFKDENDNEYVMTTDIEKTVNENKEFSFDSVDDFQRTTLVATIIITNIRKER